MDSIVDLKRGQLVLIKIDTLNYPLQVFFDKWADDNKTEFFDFKSGKKYNVKQIISL